MTSMVKNGFVHSGPAKSIDDNYSPICEYRNLIVTELTEAVKNLAVYVPGIEAYADHAKEHCKKDTVLTLDESAAIYLYTTQTSFHSELNNRLRGENRDEVEPWLGFLKLFINGLRKLPSLATRVWRGVASHTDSSFSNNRLQTWWTINSCSKNLKVIEFYLDGTGTVYAIETIHGKDITEYSAHPSEQEVVLMPGTRLWREHDSLEIKDRPFIIPLKECGAIPEGHHVMLSHHQTSKHIVSKICQILQSEHIPVWFDEKRDMEHNMSRSLADGVENAAVVCCFMTSDYQRSGRCKIELQYAQKRHKWIIPCVLDDIKVWEPCNWLKTITADLERIYFHNVSEADINVKVLHLIDRITLESPARQHLHRQTADEPSYLFELIRQEYQENSSIERIMNPAKSYPIEHSYINLAIIETKEQIGKEKKLAEAKLSSEIIGTYEDIYGTKSKIEVDDIFERCKDQPKNILLLGRAGIGKTTFCQYVTYQWATGAMWQQYQLVILIRLRHLTGDRYPLVQAAGNYSLLDLVNKEYFDQSLSEKEKQLLQGLFDRSQVLWLLDGYDEISENVPLHVQDLRNKLLKTPHHILTSRPCLITLPYKMQLEITGFTDDNIRDYATQFFDQIKDEIKNASLEAEKLLKFMEYNHRIWCIAHIPVNLELICSFWCDMDWSETISLTLTALYDKMIEWLCRRHLVRQNVRLSPMTKEDVYARCNKELAFLESLAFHGIKKNAIMLDPKLLRIAFEESKTSLNSQPHLLNMGILKPLDHKPVGTFIEPDNNYYFVHLSFQEHLAARYLITALSNEGEQRKKAIGIIKSQKYNQRYQLVFSFVSGLLADTNAEQANIYFWKALLGEPLDLIGFRHIQVVIPCLEEARCSSNIPKYHRSLNQIIKWINYYVMSTYFFPKELLLSLLRKSPLLVNQPEILDTFVQQYNSTVYAIKNSAYHLICELPISSSHIDFISLYLATPNYEPFDLQNKPYTVFCKISGKLTIAQVIITFLNALADTNPTIRWRAQEALVRICDKASTAEVTDALVNALRTTDRNVISGACEALGKMGKKAATTEVIKALINALRNTNDTVILRACEALGKMGEKAATTEVINALMNVLRDTDHHVKSGVRAVLGRIGANSPTTEVIRALVSALGNTDHSIICTVCGVLGRMGKKAATTEVINALLNTLRSTDPNVISSACEVLGRMGEKAVTTEVIHALVNALGNTDPNVLSAACEALGTMGEKAATTEVIRTLENALGNTNDTAKWSVCDVLGRLGEKAATTEVIRALANSLGNTDYNLISAASEALRKMAENSATAEVIHALVNALGSADHNIIWRACEVLGRIGGKAATSEVINALLNALGNTDPKVISSACEVLGRMGEKAATTEVINTLVNALGNTDSNVLSSACKALGKMGKKTVTNTGVIQALVNALGNTNSYVRLIVYETLDRMGETASTTEVINTLVNALRSTDPNVISSACETLAKMGEKAASTKVIDAVVNVLGNTDRNVLSNTCKAVASMGERAATSEVINALVNALGNTDHNVLSNACIAVASMGERAATTEVISALVNALRSSDDNVLSSACKAVASMAERAAATEVITALVNALGNTHPNVLSSACKAVARMGGKGATTEVISALVNALRNEDLNVLLSACEALSRMAEKAATIEVINALVNVLGNKDRNVISSVCEVLGRMGEKAATTEVIYTLIKALGNTDHNVILSTCKALGRMGEKAATTEVLNALVNTFIDPDDSIRWNALEALYKIFGKGTTNEMLSSVSNADYQVKRLTLYGLGSDIVKVFNLWHCLSNLNSDTVEKLSRYINEWRFQLRSNIVAEKLIKAFLETEIPFWLPIIKNVFITQGHGIIITRNSVVVHDREESVEIFYQKEKLGRELQTCFRNWLEESIRTMHE